MYTYLYICMYIYIYIYISEDEVEEMCEEVAADKAKHENIKFQQNEPYKGYKENQMTRQIATNNN